MVFFTVGNLLTLGIVILILVMYRQVDRSSRSLDQLKKYAEKLKAELKSFADVTAEDVRSYGIDIKVEKESGKELLNRLRLTDEELADKAAAVSRIEERLKVYESSMEELTGRTLRVQENLDRIRDESAFVEGASRRISEAKAGLEDLERSLEGLEIRFERENAESLAKTAETVIASVNSTVSDFSETAETIERKVEDHREAVDKIEKEREQKLARDMEIVNNTLKNAVEQAGLRADRMEEAALVKLKEQARERIHKLKTDEEERLKTYQESAKNRIVEAQNLIKSFREDWKTERHDWEARDKVFREEWKNGFLEIKTEAKETEALVLKTAEDMKRKALELTENKLEEYRQVQEGEFKRLEALTEDSRKLDGELRRNMQEILARVREDFTRFELECADSRKAVGLEYSSSVSALKAEMEGLEKGLNDLKDTAYDNVSEKLKVFEDDFFADLAKRSGDIDRRFAGWQESLETRLSDMGDDAADKRRELHEILLEEMKKEFAQGSEKLLADLESLKTDTGAFEESIWGRMNAADESLASYKEQLDHILAEARESAEHTVKAEIGSYALASSEKIKQSQRELEGRLKEISDYVETRSGDLSSLLDASKRSITGLDGSIADIRSAMDGAYLEAGQRRNEIIARSDEQVRSLETSVGDADRRIKEFFEQSKLIDKAVDLKVNMERRIEDLRGDIDRLDQRRLEAAQLEGEFLKIRRMGDEVNAKMARIASEKYRIDKMEADFNRLLQISRAVEEKLTQVTSSDDTLQETVLRIRKLEEALDETDEKYQRLEKKDQVLKETLDGIDKNFKALQESEKTAGKLESDLLRLKADEEALRGEIVAVSKEGEKAREAADLISTLDSSLTELREKNQAVQKAREWLAQAESRLEDLNKRAQSQARFIDAMLKGNKDGSPPLGEGAPSLNKRETIIQLLTQGWKVEEIASNLKISRGEVELVKEVFDKH
jgi:DNA repair exonuclease SbcCD ATPase subunit